MQRLAIIVDTALGSTFLFCLLDPYLFGWSCCERLMFGETWELSFRLAAQKRTDNLFKPLESTVNFQVSLACLLLHFLSQAPVQYEAAEATSDVVGLVLSSTSGALLKPEHSFSIVLLS